MNRLPEALRRAVRTALQAFVAVFALQALGWLSAVQEWAAGGRVGDLPDPSVLVGAAIAGAAAVGIALVTYVQNALEDRGTLKDRR